MVVKLKFDGKWGQREVKTKVAENSLSELLEKPKKIDWILIEFMRKSEHIVGIEQDE